MTDLKSLSLNNLRKAYKAYVYSMDYDDNTKRTIMTDTFYLQASGRLYKNEAGIPERVSRSRFFEFFHIMPNG